ncbi:hypothetical protein Tco_0231125 [Tanacetum coccineum]
MAPLKFADSHNLVAFLEKPAESEGFEQIVDFLNTHTIKYALTVNPTVYTSCIQQFWATVKAKTVNGEEQLQALVDKKKVLIIESTIRSDLRLEDAGGIECLPNATIFEELTRMGYEKLSQKLTFYKAFFSPQWKFLIHTILQCLSAKTTAWNEFSSTMASAIICLATNQQFNFSKYIFENMVKNAENEGNFLMYPRFVQVFLDKQVGDMSTHDEIYISPSHIKKVFKKQPRRKQRKDTEVPQPTEPVADETEENVPIHSNDLPSGEDSLELKELMELCTNLQQRVLTLETTKTTQAQEIDSLKRRVKKLEKKIESSDDEANLEGDEVIVDAADTTVGDTTTTTEVEITLAQALVEIKTSKPKAKRIVFKEPSESTTTTTPIVSLQQSSQGKDKGKAIMIEEPVKTKKKVQIMLDKEAVKKLQDKSKRKFFAAKRVKEKRNKPPTKAQQRSFMCTYLKNMDGWKLKDLKNKSFADIKELFEKVMEKVNNFVDFRTELIEEGLKTAETEKSKKAIVPNEEEVAVDAIPLATKPPTIPSFRCFEALTEKIWKLCGNWLKLSMDQQGQRKASQAHYKTAQEQMKCLEASSWCLIKLLMKKLEILKKNIKFRGGLLGLKVFMILFEVAAALIGINATYSR